MILLARHTPYGVCGFLEGGYCGDMSVKFELDDEELRLLEASYRLVSDASAFDDVVAHWARRLDRVDSNKLDDIEHPLLSMHMQAVSDMLEKSSEDQANDPIEQVISSVTSPATVFSSGKRVAAVNERAVTAWGLKRGRTANTDWIDPLSHASFEQMLRGATIAGNQQHSIIRTIDKDGGSGIAEIYSLLEDGQKGMVAVRAIELTWSFRVSNMLEEAFGLTEAEIDVCRLLMELRDTKLIAGQRGSSFNTVRAQLLTIFEKTETKSQVDLVRLLAMISQRLNHDFGGSSAEWEDPLGREEIFLDKNGRAIAYSWAGDPDGRPALFSHGLATGYLLPDEGMRALKKHNIKLYLISRPGFGNSDPAPLDENIQVNADAVIALSRHLDIDRWIVMGQGSGSLPLFRAHSNPASAIAGIACIGIYFPFTKKMRFEDYSNTRKVALRLASASPKFADLMAKISYRSMRASGPEFIVRSIYSECEVNDALLNDPDCRAFVRAAYSMLSVHKHHALAADLRMLTSDWATDLENCKIPVRYLHGTKDPANPVAAVEKFIASRPNMGLDIVEGGGELLFFSHSELLVNTLAEMMDL
ncbi:MAG: alpha/beta hydrolase [Parasphingorhabdus sp.]|uniref:alpha/beta hydrolase n=1 Tax=Parasphingorhabdus sp. TaxID=2709688 RepID=UPI0032971E79